MPRTVPLFRLSPMLAWTGTKHIPLSLSSRAHQARMNLPRSSWCGVGSINVAPITQVSVKRMQPNIYGVVLSCHLENGCVPDLPIAPALAEWFQAPIFEGPAFIQRGISFVDFPYELRNRLPAHLLYDSRSHVQVDS